MELTYPALLTRIEDDFGIRTVVSGALATIFGWTFGSSAIPAGFLVDRLGSQRVVTGAFAGAAVLAILVGLSPNEWFLAAALGGLGLTIGLYHPAGTSLLVRGVGQRGLALGWHGVAGNVGQALAVAVALAVALGWRAAFFFLAGLAALLTLLIGTARLALPSEWGPPVSQAPSLRPRDGSRSLGRLTMPLLLIYAAFVLSGTVYRGSITFLPKHLEGFVSHDLAGTFTTMALLTDQAGAAGPDPWPAGGASPGPDRASIRGAPGGDSFGLCLPLFRQPTGVQRAHRRLRAPGRPGA